MLNFGGIVGWGAFYSGSYDWSSASSDIEKAERNMKEYGLKYREVLGIWFDTHDMIKEYGDLLEKAAEQLNLDRFIGPEFWEEEILLAKR